MNKIKLYWSMISPFIKIVLAGISMFFAIGLVLSIPLCLLWNWLMPYIFGLPTITILQAFGLSALITLLSPKDLKLTKKNNVQPIPDVEINDKLNKALEDITSQFKA
tara:strand:+ start:722 stop:1042 length:321 start_codon:yes stop_codon:yes gene_type:complete